MNFQEANALWAEHRGMLEQRGVTMPSVQSYVSDDVRYDFRIAMDAQPALSTTDPNSAVPAMLTTMIDPKVFKALFAPNKAATIMGEERRGTWIDDTIMLPVTEAAGEVSSYGDYADSGIVTSNTNWPQRQAYLFQVVKQYGERELERAGLARINWVSELDYSAALMLNKFSNLTYFFGVAGLQNYGLLNDPHLNASLTPAVKAYGGTAWYNGSNQIAATANEIYADIENLFVALVTQTAGLVDRETRMVLAMSPASEAALTTTNSFNVNVSDLLKKNFPNLRVESAVQYGVQSASNPQGIAAGNFMQLIAEELEGQETGFCGFNEKMRAHKLIPAMSSYKQKVSGGSWGCILRMTNTISSLIGI
ncbi:MAG TPA: major capsid family protein [Rhizobium sp.]